MRAFDRAQSVGEGGWALDGIGGGGKPIKLLFGETELKPGFTHEIVPVAQPAWERRAAV